ncbi:MAG: hypothetical protein M3323_10945 [Actinomycetota bacterium]|nr:hypothetical protein [Actinomycetota bacterium]
MSRLKVAALLAGIAVFTAGPVASPAHAANDIPCEIFAEPLATICKLIDQ